MLRKFEVFAKKYWIWISVVLVILIFTGAIRRLITGITIFFGNLTDHEEGTSEKNIDYDFIASTIHTDFSMKWLDWFGDNSNSEVMGLINSLPSKNSFLELCRRYALKYGEDLRERLQVKFSDSQYSKLSWK
jgi:hypothetical protein